MAGPFASLGWLRSARGWLLLRTHGHGTIDQTLRTPNSYHRRPLLAGRVHRAWATTGASRGAWWLGACVAWPPCGHSFGPLTPPNSHITAARARTQAPSPTARNRTAPRRSNAGGGWSAHSQPLPLSSPRPPPPPGPAGSSATRSCRRKASPPCSTWRRRPSPPRSLLPLASAAHPAAAAGALGASGSAHTEAGLTDPSDYPLPSPPSGDAGSSSYYHSGRGSGSMKGEGGKSQEEAAAAAAASSSTAATATRAPPPPR